MNGNMVNNINPPKFEGSTMDVASTVKMEKKKAKREVDQKVRKIEEEEKEGGRDFGFVGSGVADNNLIGVNWEDDWRWLLGSVVDEQMSWASVWSPVWDMDLMGDAFSSLYNDVVWDDDIWNLKKEIPIPSQT